MTRELSTFQSEGWYRPHGATTDHYYRATNEARAQMHTPEAVESVCRKYASGGGIRPQLNLMPSHRTCTRCAAYIQERDA